MPKRKTREKDGIYQRKDSPYWWACYPNDRSGSTRRSTGVPIADDPEGLKAHAVRASWRIETKVERTGEDASFDHLMMLYLEQVTINKRAPERDRYSLKALYPHFQGRRLADLSGADVRAYIAARRKTGIAAGTINKEVGLMSAATQWAKRELEWDVPNPWVSRRQSEPSGRHRWLTKEEAACLLDAANTPTRRARSPWLRDFIRLGLNSGLRPGEMCWLEWSRVDLKGGVITFEIEREMGQRRGQKNGKLGQVPLNQEARAALLARANFRATYCPSSPWVFCRRDGTRIESLKKGFAACVTDAGLSDVHPHDLRRTFGSWLVQRGVGIERVSDLLRHSNVSITARVYAHLRPTDLADAVAILDAPAEPETVSDFHADFHADRAGATYK
jgi:integrase